MHDACCCYPGILGNRYSSIRGGYAWATGGVNQTGFIGDDLVPILRLE